VARRLLLPTDMTPPADFAPRRVLIVVEDESLAELLDELLREAGHYSARLDDAGLPSLSSLPHADVILVDLDRHARDGVGLLARLRRAAPASTIVALLPCGGLPRGAGDEPIDCDVAVEKPARLRAVLAAIGKMQER
jgi:DNA-binding response OmpR family regulator